MKHRSRHAATSHLGLAITCTLALSACETPLPPLRSSPELEPIELGLHPAILDHEAETTAFFDAHGVHQLRGRDVVDIAPGLELTHPPSVLRVVSPSDIWLVAGGHLLHFGDEGWTEVSLADAVLSADEAVSVAVVAVAARMEGEAWALVELTGVPTEHMQQVCSLVATSWSCGAVPGDPTASGGSLAVADGALWLEKGGGLLWRRLEMGARWITHAKRGISDLRTLEDDSVAFRWDRLVGTDELPEPELRRATVAQGATVLATHAEQFAGRSPSRLYVLSTDVRYDCPLIDLCFGCEETQACTDYGVAWSQLIVRRLDGSDEVEVGHLTWFGSIPEVGHVFVMDDGRLVVQVNGTFHIAAHTGYNNVATPSRR